MPDYKEMYKSLFQAQTQSIESLEQALETLKKAQQEIEEMYLSAPDPEILVLPDRSKKNLPELKE